MNNDKTIIALAVFGGMVLGFVFTQELFYLSPDYNRAGSPGYNRKWDCQHQRLVVSEWKDGIGDKIVVQGPCKSEAK